MKRKALSAILSLGMALTLVCSGSMFAFAEESEGEEAEAAEAEESTGGLKLGFACQTLSNQIWAQQADEFQARAEADGNQATVVDCDENANTQIDQLENFITAGLDAFVVQPVDPDAIEDVCQKAREAGIIVFSWDEEMENSDVNWLIENYDLGYEIGSQAAAWINDNFGDDGCEVVVLGYPQTPILLERENGIIDALADAAPAAEVVANQPAIDTTEGLNAMETILQTNPDVKCVCCIGGGGATGANEALKGYYGDEIAEDVAIFSTDLTDEAIAAMENGEYNNTVIAITGNAVVSGDVCYDLLMDVINGDQDDHNVYRDLIPVTIDNLEEMK